MGFRTSPLAFHLLLHSFGDDRLYGGYGDDTLFGAEDNDTADGGPGTDTCTAESEVNCEI